MKSLQTGGETPTIERTIVSITVQVEELKKEYVELDKIFSEYLASVKPNEKDLYLADRKAAQIYPRVPYYITGTNETGEFWVEPKITDAGELMFNFRLIDPTVQNDMTRSVIQMNIEQLKTTQKGLFKLHRLSVTARDRKIREPAFPQNSVLTSARRVRNARHRLKFCFKSTTMV